MTTLASACYGGLMSGTSSAGAGEAALKIQTLTLEAVKEMKSKRTAGSSAVFNDLHALAQEVGVEVRASKVFGLAQRFLLALPTYCAAPELTFDADGEVVFDWLGKHGEMLTVALRGDGRVAYAARLSAFDKEHGTKPFVDTVPRKVVELIWAISGT